jgi:hypothetical protein
MPYWGGHIHSYGDPVPDTNSHTNPDCYDDAASNGFRHPYRDAVFNADKYLNSNRYTYNDSCGDVGINSNATDDADKHCY